MLLIRPAIQFLLNLFYVFTDIWPVISCVLLLLYPTLQCWSYNIYSRDSIGTSLIPDTLGRFLFDSIQRPCGEILILIHVLVSNIYLFIYYFFKIPARFLK